MKVFKLILNSVIFPACAIYTLLTLATTAFMTLISDTVTKPALPLSSCVMFLFMSLCISASTLVFRSPKLPLYLKILINFASTLISIIAVLSFGSYDLDSNSLVLFLVYTFLYIIIGLPIIFVTTRIKSKTGEEKDYVSMFGDK